MIWDTKTVILIAVSVINCIIIVTMKFNDLHHLEKGMSELKAEIKHYIKKLYSLAQRVSRIEGEISK